MLVPLVPLVPLLPYSFQMKRMFYFMKKSKKKLQIEADLFTVFTDEQRLVNKFKVLKFVLISSKQFGFVAKHI